MRYLIGIILLSVNNYTTAIDQVNSINSRTCLAEVIYRESRGESFKGKLAVGQVVVNRVKSSKYPQTICGVVFQKSQFSWTNSFKRFKATKDFLQLADIVLAGNHALQSFNATHFHAKRVRPSWSHNLRRIDIIGNHIFYKP